MNGIRRLLALGIALLAAAVITTPAAAQPPAAPSTGGVLAGFGSWAEVYAFQDRLNAAATEILAADGSGNASIIASPRNRELRVHWNGTVPATVRQRAAALGVPVSFLPAAYRYDKLVAEARRLATDPRVADVAPRPDGSGLDVTVVARGVRADLSSASRLPLTVTAGEKPQALFSRQDDVPRFWGGSRYQTAIGLCTNGFGLSVPGAANVFEISAGHCGNNGGVVAIPLQPVPTGTILAKSACRDTLVINYPTGVNGVIYRGPAASGVGVSVGGVVPDFVGNVVNTGGASSGEHLNLTVTNVNVFAAVAGIPCAAVGPLVRAVAPAGQCAVAAGDSGGPAYSYNGNALVFGRGTITAGAIAVPCPPTPGGFNSVFYAPLIRPGGDPQIGSLQFYGVTLIGGAPIKP